MADNREWTPINTKNQTSERTDRSLGLDPFAFLLGAEGLEAVQDFFHIGLEDDEFTMLRADESLGGIERRPAAACFTPARIPPPAYKPKPLFPTAS